MKNPRDSKDPEAVIRVLTEVARDVFERDGNHVPLVIAGMPDAMHVIAVPPGASKDETAWFMRQLFRVGATTVSLINEAWLIRAESKEDNDALLARRDRWLETHEDLAEFPGRVEVIVISTRSAATTWIAEAEILREEGKPPRLGEWEIYQPDRAEGRFADPLVPDPSSIPPSEN